MSKDVTKKEKKAPSAYVVIFLITVVVAVLTWIIPGGVYELDEAGNAIAGTFSSAESNPQGIWDIGMAPINGMTGAIAISLSIMLFGSFLQMMDETGAIKIYLSNIAKKFQSNYHVLIWVLVFIMGMMGTTEGCYEEGIIYMLMFMPIIMALGLDTVVTVMIIVFGTQGGCLASIINPFAVGVASGIAGISPGEGMLTRIVLFVVVLSLISIYICRYADKVKADPTKSSQYYRREEDLKQYPIELDGDKKPTKEQKYSIIVFIMVFVILIIGCIPWTSLNENFTFFQDFVTWIGDVPILGMILGKDITAFGDWYFGEISLLVLVGTFIVGMIHHFDMNQIIDIVMQGAASVVPTALVVPMARGIQVLMSDGGITSTILHFGESTLSSLPPVVFVLVCMVFYFAFASLMPSSTGLAAATMSIMAPLAVFAGVHETVMINIYLVALGLAKMIMPTSIVVMTCTQANHIGYGQWVKSNWKFVALLAAVCYVIIVTAGVIL